MPHSSLPVHFDTLHTVRDWLRWSVSQFNKAQLFFGHGCATAYDEAVYLILHTLHLPLDQLEPFLDAHLTEPEKRDLHTILKARIETRKPAAYLTHEAWLKTFKFYVDERTIIPRSLIAHMLLEEETGFIQPWIESMSEPPSHILDLCTGSGCLAIILSYFFPDAHVDAVDLSADALEVARRNVDAYSLQNRLSLYQGDLFAPLSTASGKKNYDMIISNPPYVTQESMQKLPEEYRHEPSMALEAGEKGLECIRHIIEQAKSYLKEEGILVVEVGHQRTDVEAAYPELPFIWFEAPENEGNVFLLSAMDLESIGDFSTPL